MINKIKRRILIVDDEEDLRMLLGDVLTSAGYDITTASDGEEAIATLSTQMFDVVLLDIQMPRMNGIQVLKHINDHHPSTKSIIITGYADLHHATEARKLGAHDFIAKPYTLEDIMSSIERVPPAK